MYMGSNIFNIFFPVSAETISRSDSLIGCTANALKGSMLNTNNGMSLIDKVLFIMRQYDGC